MAGRETWALRHGETEWSRLGRHTGRTDLPLTPAGRREAEGLRARLAGRRFALVLSSPLARAWETCRLAGLGEAAERCDDLMEWDYGAYEGLTREEILARAPGWNLWTAGAPGGEDAAAVGARADRVIARVRAASGDVVLFAHGHLLRVLAARWLGLAPAVGGRLALGTAALGILALDEGRQLLRAWNLGPGERGG